ncbi:MAG: hypothetical protein WA667_22320 [Candidatus Nitrosopolaris sp.]
MCHTQGIWAEASRITTRKHRPRHQNRGQVRTHEFHPHFSSSLFSRMLNIYDDHINEKLFLKEEVHSSRTPVSFSMTV